MIEARRQPTTEGAILFDATLLAQAGVEAVDAAWFDASHWRAQQRAHDVRGGRGSASFIDTPFGRCVLRHYRRGGMAANWMGDNYLWTGESRTRAFREFRLLAALWELELPVPQPLAARYVRNGLSYRCDLITRKIDDANTLAELIEANRCDGDIARRIGSTLSQFHSAGAYHADLNAHNILITNDAVWLIDFDRGALRHPAPAWRRANLERLHRSCAKILHRAPTPGSSDRDFHASVWTPLLQAYDETFASADAAALRSVGT